MTGKVKYRYFIRLCYDGSQFHGWQRQPNGMSVQQALEDAMSMMLRVPVRLTGAGRTDTGVHAAQYFAHFDLDENLGEQECSRLTFKLNSFLPPAIAIQSMEPVKIDLHARFSALSRTYKYYISKVKTPFRSAYTHYIYGDLDIGLMNAGAGMLLEVSDFTSFSKVDTDARTNICKVSRAIWEAEGEELVFTITANRFLRNMVRAIVGTLLDLGKHRITLEEFGHIIATKNRSDAGDSVPACGLHLFAIEYPQSG
jgi:tRNA pseudouridine38-40 synthase